MLWASVAHGKDLEDAHFDLAGELLPESPAAVWDFEWASELVRDAVAFLAEWGVGGPARCARAGGFVATAVARFVL